MIYQFKIQLKNVSKPPVWRRLQIPGEFTLDMLHECIQASFGWENYHMYQFSPNGWASHPNFGIKEDDEDAFEVDEDSREHNMQEIFYEKGQKMIYIYDFGDDWQHQITVEKMEDGTLLRPTLMAGKGACPEEDSGGTWAYEGMKEEEGPEDFDIEETKAFFNANFDGL